ncbi:serine hydrolase [Clostridium polynesiense]|uniref:serine hydrolase n=1 Tax=Clostridium polynesiense TaxID=1325933 RepID=UPI000A75952C|nr:serine hydrolase [Clostridium polynesiense]
MRKNFIIKTLAAVMAVGFSVVSMGSVSAKAAAEGSATKPSSIVLKKGVPSGLDNGTLNKIDDLVNQNIKDGVFPGGVILVAKDGVVAYEKAFGDAQKYDMGKLLTNPRKAQTSTIYDLASVTKVMGTTQAIMKLSYEKKIDVNETVAKYIPEFAKNGKEKVKVKDLLTHTSGLTPWKPTFYYASNPKEELEFICNLPLEYETGTDRKYSDFSFMTLAFIVEAVTNMPLDKYLEQEVYAKLGMKDTMFTPDAALKGRIAATSWGNPYEYRMVADDNFGYVCDENVDDFKGWRNYTLVGEVNDGNAFYANKGVAGHAGLFSTASDLAILGQLMLNGGVYNNVRLYDQATIDEFTSIQSKFGHGYGWEINRGGEKSGYMGKYADENVFGHTGFTGTQVVFDKANNLQIISLTNKQNNGVTESGNYKSTFKFSRDLANIVYESILPEIKVSGVENDKIYTAPVKPVITAGKEDKIVEVLLNGQPYDNTEISAAGKYTLTIKAVDKYGKESIKEIKFSIEKAAEEPKPSNPNQGNNSGDNTGNGQITDKTEIPNTGDFGANVGLLTAVLLASAGIIIKTIRR